MADLPPSSRSRHDPDDDPRDPGDAPGTPRWVIAFGIVAAVLVLLFVALHLAGGGFRSHGRHG
jgi:hypothetical protein